MSANSLVANPTVAPAKAGAYRALRFRLTDVMGPSLRWDDGGWFFKALFRWNRINLPNPEIKMDAYPNAKLRFVVDARRLHEELPRGKAKRFGKASAARGLADDLAIFDAVIFGHPTSNIGRSAGRNAFDGGEIRRKFAVIRFAQPCHRIKLRAPGAKARAHHAFWALSAPFAVARATAATCG